MDDENEPQITKTMLVFILLISLFAIGIGTYVEVYQGGVIDSETKDMLITTGQIGLWFVFPMSLFGYYIGRHKKEFCEFVYNKREVNKNE